MFALVAPNEITGFTPWAFARIPLEGLVGVVLVLVLPVRGRRAVVALAGVVLSLLAIVKLVDLGFHATLGRPFSPVLDGSFLTSGGEFLSQSIGGAGALGVLVAIVLLVLAVIALMTLSVVRLTRIAIRHRGAATRVLGVLGVVWAVCAVSGAQVAVLSLDRAVQMGADLRERKPLNTRASDDPFHDITAGETLTALRGKDVLFAFVESYGRDALTDPTFAPQVGAALEAGNRRLEAAGYASRSAFLTSPTMGGGSWLAHSTLLSGLWIDTQQRHHTLVHSDRLTLTRAFRRGGWRTVAVMPGNTREWGEAGFYGYDQVYNRPDLGYRGLPFNWDTPPDQYTLATFQRTERDRKDRAPIMAEIPLVSSHSPWAPTPRLVGWDDVGDGTVFNPIAEAGDTWQEVWRSPSRMRTAYRGSIVYTLDAVFSYVATYGGDDLVVVLLGDHQPSPVITGPGADRDVPITVLARDRAVLDRISGWGWRNGLRPAPDAPLWRMDAFRDRFLTAFGTRPRNLGH